MALADEMAGAEAKQIASATVSIPLKIQWTWFQPGKTEETGSHRPPPRHTCVTTTTYLENSATVEMGTTHTRSADVKRQHVTFVRKEDILFIMAACRTKNSETHLVNSTLD